MWHGMSNVMYVVVPWKWLLFSGRSPLGLFFSLFAIGRFTHFTVLWVKSWQQCGKTAWLLFNPQYYSVVCFWLILSLYSPDLLRKAVLLDCALLNLQDWCSLLHLLPCIFYINVLIKTSDHDGWVFMSVTLLWTMKSGRKSPGTWEMCGNELVLCELLTCSSRQSLELTCDLR